MRVALFIASAAFIFGPRFRYVDVHMLTALGFAFLGLLLLIRERVALPGFSHALIAVMPTLLYAALIGLLHGAADLTVTWVACKALIYLLAAYAVVHLYTEVLKRNPDQAIFRDVYWVGVVNACFVVAVVLSPQVREVASALLVLDGKEHWVMSGFRGFDLSMGGGAAGSIVLAMILVGAMSHTRALGPTWMIAPGMVVLLLGILFTGRSGLAFALAGMGLLAVRALSRSGQRVGSIGMVTSFALLICGVAGYMLFSTNPTAVQVREVVLPWALEGLIQGEAETSGNHSLNRIVEGMYFLPPSDTSALFGSSNTGRSERLPYIASDVGYIRLVFSVGVIGTVLAIVSFVPIGAAAIVRRGALLSFPVLFAVLAHLIANGKELFIAHRGGGAVLALWFVGLIATSRAKELALNQECIARPSAGSGVLRHPQRIFTASNEG